MIEITFVDPIQVWNGDLEDSGYLWRDLEETKLSGGALGAGEEAIEHSILPATMKINKILGSELRSGALNRLILSTIAFRINLNTPRDLNIQEIM